MPMERIGADLQYVARFEPAAVAACPVARETRPAAEVAEQQPFSVAMQQCVVATHVRMRKTQIGLTSAADETRRLIDPDRLDPGFVRRSENEFKRLGVQVCRQKFRGVGCRSRDEFAIDWRDRRLVNDFRSGCREDEVISLISRQRRAGPVDRGVGARPQEVPSPTIQGSGIQRHNIVHPKAGATIITPLCCIRQHGSVETCVSNWIDEHAMSCCTASRRSFHGDRQFRIGRGALDSGVRFGPELMGGYGSRNPAVGGAAGATGVSPFGGSLGGAGGGVS